MSLLEGNFDSVSEGCFLVMPGKKRSRVLSTSLPKSKRAKPLKATSIKATHRSEWKSKESQHDGFQLLYNGREPLKAMLKRKEFLSTCWKTVEDLFNESLLGINQAAIQEICDFVNKDHDMTHHSLISLPFHEIPTGLVFAGINTPDHSTQFEYIATQLRAKTGTKKENYVALLQSKDCMNLKNMMKSMIERFMASATEEDGSEKTDIVEDTTTDAQEEEEEEEGDEEDMIRFTERRAVGYQLGGSFSKPSKCLPFDMQWLEGWYQHQCQQRHHGKGKPNLVVILQDFESFEPSMLQDFLSICSEYRSKLPFVCIMGIATSIEILHQTLSKATMSLLRIEKFKLEQSEVWFNRVIEKLFLDSTRSLKFGGRAYKFLLDHFYLYDFSISTVTSSVKYAFMHHFYGNPLSLFLPLLELDKDAMASTVSEWLTEGILNEHHMTHVRMLRSIKSYVESLVARQEVQKAMRVLEDDDYVMKAIVPELLTDIKTYQIQFKLGIHLLELLQSQFPNFGFFATHRQKSKRILLLDALQATTEEGMAGSELTKALIALIRGISEKHIGTLLQQMRALFEKEDYREVNEAALKELFGWEVRLEHLAQADRDTVARMDRKARLLEGLVLPGAQTARQTATAQRVQENSIEHLRNKGTAIAKLAMDIADWCERTLRLYLRPYTTLPLHELIYYNTISLHEKAFAAQPRATIQTALTQSGHYLGCSCCRMDKADQILFSEHDTCILYKLYLECGRMINLYDWFIAFGCIIEREQRPIKQKLEENEVQARFIRSVAELQFLGFIKPTQRKTDHVIRLTWSNI